VRAAYSALLAGEYEVSADNRSRNAKQKLSRPLEDLYPQLSPPPLFHRTDTGADMPSRRTSTCASTEPAYFDWETRVAAPVLGIGEVGIPVFGDPCLTPLAVPLHQMTVGLLVTSGAYYRDQPRMRHHNDLSHRLPRRERDLSEVLFAHRTPIRAFRSPTPTSPIRGTA
jgi:hypothetical protein